MIMLGPVLAVVFAQQSYGDMHARLLEQVERRYSAYAKDVLRHDVYAVMNRMTPDVTWTLADGKKLDRVEVVQQLGPWMKAMESDGVLRFHVNRMWIKSEDQVQTEIEVLYAPKGAPFPPKRKKDEKIIWKEDLVKVSERWLLKHGEQVQRGAGG